MNALSFVEAYADVESSLQEYHLGVEAHEDKDILIILNQNNLLFITLNRPVTFRHI